MTTLANPAFTFLGLRLKPILIELQRDIASLEKKTSPYETYARYLQQKDRTAYLSEVKSLLRRIHSLRSRAFFATWRNRVLLRSLQSRTYTVKNFLEGFCFEYVSAEVKRRKAFFDEARLDEEQKAAVVKDASHHLVLAAAGSGKTRALTARIALLIERGVPQERILALTYTNASVDEMTARLNSQYGIKANVNTFHSFCHDLAKGSPDYRSGVAGAKEHQFIREAAERLGSKDKDFALKMLNFAEEFKRAEEKKQHEFPTAEEYYNYLRHQEYKTLNLVPVKSIAECEIGNFLFLHGVRFEYEASAKWADRSPAFRDYQPDFFLPDNGLYLEHWATDRKGRVPDWFSDGGSGDPSKRYRNGMGWKKDQFKKQNRKLIETFHYEWAEGTLFRDLTKQLEANGVVLAELPMDEVISRIDREVRHDPLHELVLSFIKRGKTNGLGPSDIEARLSESGRWTKKQRDFASLMVPIWGEYETLLRENNMLDFNDMVTLALQVARKKDPDLAKQYSHILVDEFQDITDPQLELIRCVSSGSRDDMTLFCVGDHRQNIFSFAGSNVKNILEFDESFPDSEKTLLSTNYRCPSNVVRASNQLMVSRADATPAVPASTEIRPIRLIQKSDGLPYDKWELQSAKTLLTELLEKKNDDEDILVLARYNFRYQDLEMALGEQAKRGLMFASIHGAKGMEADYVLLLGCVGGLFGFPSAILDDELLDIVSNRKQDKDEKLEEERRLFYVALTRCRKQLYIFTSELDRSPFLAEIEELRHRDDGYCIRSGHRITFNTKEPLCPDCRRKWDQYGNRNYGERYCHSCGERTRTTFAKPLCRACWRKSK